MGLRPELALSILSLRLERLSASLMVITAAFTRISPAQLLPGASVKLRNELDESF